MDEQGMNWQDLAANSTTCQWRLLHMCFPALNLENQSYCCHHHQPTTSPVDPHNIPWLLDLLGFAEKQPLWWIQKLWQTGSHGCLCYSLWPYDWFIHYSHPKHPSPFYLHILIHCLQALFLCWLTLHESCEKIKRSLEESRRLVGHMGDISRAVYIGTSFVTNSKAEDCAAVKPSDPSHMLIICHCQAGIALA